MKSSGIEWMSHPEMVRARANLNVPGTTVFDLAGEGVRTKAEFFDAVRRVLPLDPPVSTPNWDALDDSLWEGLHALHVEKIAIFWTGAEDLRRADPSTFDVALSVFSDAVANLADRELTLGSPTELVILIEAPRGNLPAG